MLRKIILGVLFAFPFFIFAQKSIDSLYRNYFNESRELPYLHLNKTTFLRGENIWFKAYVIDQNSKKLHPKTTDLHIAIFDDQNKLKQRQLIKIKNGIGTGNIYLDSTYSSGNYTIKAMTNWMRNFKEAQPFVQKISLLGSNFSNVNKSINKIDFQLFPEGGQLVENTESVIGVLVKNISGQGVRIDYGIVRNKSGEIVKEFKTNNLGLGKISLFYEPDEQYTTEILLKDTSSIIREIPVAQPNGVVLNIDSSHPAYISIGLSTNKETLNILTNKTYKILIHNTSSMSYWSHTFNSDNILNYVIIKRSKIPYGTNIVTIFNENDIPVLERVFFNYHKDLFNKIEFTNNETKRDSTTISMLNTDKEKSFFSISFLPSNTLANNPSKNIYSTFLLDPYINGNVENPNYYFQKISRTKLSELDLLLISQGWSKYKWEDIYKNDIVLDKAFESGISLKGVLVNQNVRDSTLMLIISKENGFIKPTPIYNGRFEFENLDLIKESNINFALGRKRIGKPRAEIEFDKLFEMTPPVIQFAGDAKDSTELEFTEEFVFDDHEQLDTITITGTRKPERPLAKYGLFESINTEKIRSKFLSILDYIRQKGFRVKESNFSASIYNPRAQRLMNRIPMANVYLDGIQLSSEFNQFGNSLNMLLNTYIRDYSEIHLSKMGNGEIHLITNRDINSSWGKNRYHKERAPYGYSIEKEYYQPKYVTTTTQLFENYGAIFWKAENILNEGEITTMKIPRLNQNEVKVIIEGITENGKLISQENIIKLQ